jgi:plastocyanin
MGGSYMRKLVGVVIVAAVIAVPAVSAVASSPAKKVSLGDFFFRPKSMTIRHGTKVTWTWSTFGIKHNVVVKSGPAKFRSATLAKGSFSFTFNKKGTYHLTCTLHPTLMSETVVVN